MKTTPRNPTLRFPPVFSLIFISIILDSLQSSDPQEGSAFIHRPGRFSAGYWVMNARVMKLSLAFTTIFVTEESLISDHCTELYEQKSSKIQAENETTGSVPV